MVQVVDYTKNTASQLFNGLKHENGGTYKPLTADDLDILFQRYHAQGWPEETVNEVIDFVLSTGVLRELAKSAYVANETFPQPQDYLMALGYDKQSGSVQNVYFPAVWKCVNADLTASYILKAGEDCYTITQQGKKFVCGELRGECSFHEVNESVRGLLELETSDGSFMFSIPLMFDYQQQVSVAELKQSVREGLSFASFLKLEAKYKKLADFAVGTRLSIQSLDYKPDSEYYPYNIVTSGGTINANTQLKEFIDQTKNAFKGDLVKMIAQVRKFDLVITGRRKLGNGNTQVLLSIEFNEVKAQNITQPTQIAPKATKKSLPPTVDTKVTETVPAPF